MKMEDNFDLWIRKLVSDLAMSSLHDMAVMAAHTYGGIQDGTPCELRIEIVDRSDGMRYLVACHDLPDLFAYLEEGIEDLAPDLVLSESYSGVDLLLLLILEHLKTGRLRPDEVNPLPL